MYNKWARKDGAGVIGEVQRGEVMRKGEWRQISVVQARKHFDKYQVICSK